MALLHDGFEMIPLPEGTFSTNVLEWELSSTLIAELVKMNLFLIDKEEGPFNQHMILNCFR